MLTTTVIHDVAELPWLFLLLRTQLLHGERLLHVLSCGKHSLSDNLILLTAKKIIVNINWPATENMVLPQNNPLTPSPYSKCNCSKERHWAALVYILTFKPQYPHVYSPHYSPYISYLTRWRNLIKHQHISCLVIICFILTTCIFDQLVILRLKGLKLDLFRSLVLIMEGAHKVHNSESRWKLVHAYESNWQLVLWNKQLVSLAARHSGNYGVTGGKIHQRRHRTNLYGRQSLVLATSVTRAKKLLFCQFGCLVDFSVLLGKKKGKLLHIYFQCSVVA